MPEILELKRKVFKSLDELATDHVILASSTSCLPATSFTSELKHKSQCIVAHPVRIICIRGCYCLNVFMKLKCFIKSITLETM